ncbi:MAG: pilus assembly protein TadG-related protein, partial [Anaerolineae bacterium]
MPKDRESGQSIIIIAAAVVVLLALVALVVDVGNAYAQRRRAQNAVDAAALAGARRLAERAIGEVVLEIHVLNDVNRFADENGLDPKVVDAWFIDADGDRL